MRPAGLRPRALSALRQIFSSNRSRALAVALLLIGLGSVGSALASGALRGWSHSAALDSAAVQDTVAVYGPKRFDSGKGKPALHVERFTVSAVPGTRYTLRLQNGAADGAQQASSASVVLNGAEVVSSSEFGRGGSVHVRPVELRGENVLEVTVQGPAESHVSLSVLQVPDPTFTVFGPRTVERGASSPTRVVERFTLPTTAAPPYALHVSNGAADGSARSTSAVVRINGQTVLSPSELNPKVGALLKPVSLAAENTVEVELYGDPGAQLTVRLSATDTTPPVLTLSAPAPGLVTKVLELEVSGSVQDETATQVWVNEQSATRSGAAFNAKVPLAAEGENRIEVRAVDAAGNRTDSTRVVIRDTQPPVLSLVAPAEGAVTRAGVMVVSGTVQDRTPVKLNVNGVPVTPDASGSFQAEVPLVEGPNFLTVSAEDAAGNGTSQVRQVTMDSQPPVLVVSEPVEGAAIQADSVLVKGTAQDATAVTLSVNGAAVAVGADGSFSAPTPLTAGSNTIAVVATDAAGNASTQAVTVTRTDPEGPLPPDPATVAPQLNQTVATDLGTATSFLYTGDNPIQTGVAPGTINPVRASVVRGRVLSRDGRPLGGVEVVVKDHPELGRTLSRADGAFDLAVNGGSVLTLQYGKAGYLPAHRQVKAPWQDYSRVEDVVLIKLDPQVTAVSLSPTGGDAQVVRGTVVQDADGARQATLIFDAGTTAALRMPDGTTQTVSSLSIRATEYTVGENGPEAMPAALPPTSAYTYALELSADEAIAAGARGVEFSKPVAFYVENFLGFPIGTPVPVGYYDVQKAAWIPMDNGRVIKILGISGGVAEVDADGNGTADDAQALAALGIDQAERERLAQAYAAGTSLWRVQTTHFSVLDLNWGSFLGGLQDMLGGGSDEEENKDEDEPECQKGSIIECQNQVLGERIGITGTGLSLNYRSNRVPGRSAAYTRKIELTRASVPTELRRVELEIDVAGRHFTQSFVPAPNLTYTFTWDGKDAYGRSVQGEQVARIRIGYVYARYYTVPASSARSFGLTCTESTGSGMQSCLIPASVSSGPRTEDTRWFEQSAVLGVYDARAQGLGGWTLSVHHAYDPGERILHTGDGASVKSPPAVVHTAAGGGSSSSDGVLATDYRLHEGTSGVTVAADGSIYLSTNYMRTVKRIRPDGIITHVAGGLYCWYGQGTSCGDGGPATAAGFHSPGRLALGLDGSLYIPDYGNHAVRRITPDGIITRFAGTGTQGFSGDGGPAASAQLNGPAGVAVAPDGSIYISDNGNRRVRRVDPDGIITTIAGNGQQCVYYDPASCYGDGGPAVRAAIGNVRGIALHSDGSLYLVDGSSQRIRRVGPSGMVTTFAGAGTCSPSTAPCGDGGPAAQAGLSYPADVAVTPDGSVYILQSERLRKVSPNGIIQTVAGTGEQRPGSPTEGSLATQALLQAPIAIAVGPGAAIFLADGNRSLNDFGLRDGRILRISSTLPGFDAREIGIASGDGREVHQFDAHGRHLRTLNALTGAVLYRFSYDAGGLLTAVTDGNGNITRIERDGAGKPVAIVAPFGQRTALSTSAEGYLASVANPAGHTVRLGYGAGGLLGQLSDAKSNLHRYRYDSMGRLERDEGPAGGFKALARSEDDIGYTISLSTAMGRTDTYRVERLAAGGSRRVNTDPVGLKTVTTSNPDGSEITTTPDGVVVTKVEAGDPRFGMQGPVVSRTTVTTPAGLRLNTSSRRIATLAQPGNPLSLSTLTDSQTVNGRVFANAFNASLREFTSSTPEGRQGVSRVDSLGRVIEQQIPGLNPVQYSYNVQGQLVGIKQGVRSWTYAYDARGRLASMTDPLQQKESYFYDEADRLERQVLPNGREIRYAYDPNGNRTSLTPPGRPSHVFGYNAVDLTENYTPPALGGDPVATRYGYNLDRQVERITRPDGLELQFRYDAGGRLDTLTTPSGQVAYSYNSTTGSLASITTLGGSTLSYSYDGFLPTEVRWSGEVSGTVAVRHNHDLWVVAQKVNGDSIAFNYDRDGLLTRAGALGITRNAQNGLVMGTTLGNVTQRLGYNAFGELAGDTVTFGSAVLLQRSYARDDLGRIVSLTENMGSQPVVYAFAYDSIGRLKEVKRDGAPVESYEYDENGNRQRFTGPNGTLTGSYDAQDRLLQYGETAYAYSANGELQTKVVGTDTTRYEYDVLGNLRRVALPDGTRIEYLIDGRNRRIGKKINGTLIQGLLYAGQLNPVAELNGSGQIVSRFVYGTRSSVPDYMVRGGRMYRLVSDQLGSVRLVVDISTGDVVQRIAYDAYGRMVQNTNPGFQPFSFAGGLYDEHTELIRFGARDYDARTGRWTVKDPIGFAGQSSNLYAYALEDPVNRLDPNGMQWIMSSPSMANMPRTAAAGAFVTQLLNLKIDNTVNGDKYFHCKANCQAAQQGPAGESTARFLSDAWEAAQKHWRDDPQSEEDQKANRCGREWGRNDPDKDCRDLCAPYRVEGINQRY